MYFFCLFGRPFERKGKLHLSARPELGRCNQLVSRRSFLIISRPKKRPNGPGLYFIPRIRPFPNGTGGGGVDELYFVSLIVINTNLHNVLFYDVHTSPRQIFYQAPQKLFLFRTLSLYISAPSHPQEILIDFRLCVHIRQIEKKIGDTTHSSHPPWT